MRDKKKKLMNLLDIDENNKFKYDEKNISMMKIFSTRSDKIVIFDKKVIK